MVTEWKTTKTCTVNKLLQFHDDNRAALLVGLLNLVHTVLDAV